MTYMQLEAAFLMLPLLVNLLKPKQAMHKAVCSGGVATSLWPALPNTLLWISLFSIRESVCCLGLPVSPLLLVWSKPSALCLSPLGMLPSLPLVAPPSSEGPPAPEGPPVPSVRVLTISRTKDGMSTLVSGSELLDAVPSGTILVVLSLRSWPCRTCLRPMASVTLTVTVHTEVVSELVPSSLVLGDT